MVLVSNVYLPILFAESGINHVSMSIDVEYGTLMEIISRNLKDVKSAEMYWNGDMSGICDVLRRNGIEPVRSVNKIQAGMQILVVRNENSAILYNIRFMR